MPSYHDYVREGVFGEYTPLTTPIKATDDHARGPFCDRWVAGPPHYDIGPSGTDEEHYEEMHYWRIWATARGLLALAERTGETCIPERTPHDVVGEPEFHNGPIIDPNDIALRAATVFSCGRYRYLWDNVRALDGMEVEDLIRIGLAWRSGLDSAPDDPYAELEEVTELREIDPVIRSTDQAPIGFFGNNWADEEEPPIRRGPSGTDGESLEERDYRQLWRIARGLRALDVAGVHSLPVHVADPSELTPTDFLPHIPVDTEDPAILAALAWMTHRTLWWELNEPDIFELGGHGIITWGQTWTGP